MSETKNLKLFKNDEPLSTNENEFDVDKSLNKNWDKVDDAFGKQNIDVEQLKRESFDFKNVLPSVSDSGENITLNNTTEATFKNFKIRGNSWQETREGYNLLNVPSVLNVNTKNVKYSAPIPANTEITISWKDFIKGGESNPAIDFRNSNNSAVNYHELSENENSYTFTTTEEIVSSNIYSNGYSYDDSKSINSTINELMVNIGEAKKYEEYGVSPSSNFPSKIQNCGDNINLLNIYDIRSVGYSTTLNGVDITFLEKGAIKLNGTPTKAFSIPLVGVHQSGNYKLDLDGNYILNGLVNGCSISFFNGTNNIGEFTVSNKVIAIKQKIDYVILSIKANASFDNEIIYPCLKKGTVETPYSKFGEGNVNFKTCNKNLRGDLQNGYWDNANKTLLNKDSLIFKSFKVFVRAGTYTLSCNTKINIIRAFTENNNGEYVIFSDTAININSYTMTIEKDTTLYVSVRRNDNTNWLNTDLLQLELGEVKTNYTEHKEQNLTFSLKQKFYKNSYLTDDGIHHKRKQIELTGTKSWFFTSNCVYTNAIINSVKKPSSNSEIADVLCNIYLKDSLNNCYNNVNNKRISINSQGFVYIYDTDFKTADEWKAYLVQQKANGTPIMIEYDLEEEEIEEYNEEQKAVYNEIIKTAKSYKDTTHIFSTDELSCNFEVEAFRDLSSLFAATTVAE